MHCLLQSSRAALFAHFPPSSIHAQRVWQTLAHSNITRTPLHTTVLYTYVCIWNNHARDWDLLRRLTLYNIYVCMCTYLSLFFYYIFSFLYVHLTMRWFIIYFIFFPCSAEWNSFITLSFCFNLCRFMFEFFIQHCLIWHLGWNKIVEIISRQFNDISLF